MNVFEEVKARTDIVKLCHILGLRLDRNYKCLCPFPDHKEKTPSFSVHPSKNIFNCFGCGKKGDAITLVENLLNITPLEAADYINKNLGLGIDFNTQNDESHYRALLHKYEQERKQKRIFEKKENEMFQRLCDLFHKLENRRKSINPFTDEYVKIAKNLNTVEYYLDFFMNGTSEDIEWIMATKEKEVRRIEQGR